MTTFLLVLLAYFIGFWLGKRVGVAQTMLRMEGIIADLQRIEYVFKRKTKEWNEDNQ